MEIANYMKLYEKYSAFGYSIFQERYILGNCVSIYIIYIAKCQY